MERYAETADTSMSKAIASLVRLGLETQEDRKREFFKRLQANLADDDPNQQDRVVDEFRALILGRRSMPRIQWEGLPRDPSELAERKAQDRPRRFYNLLTSPRRPAGRYSVAGVHGTDTGIRRRASDPGL